MSAVAPPPVTHLRENPLTIARAQLRLVADAFGIDDNLVHVLEQCKKAVEVAVPVSMDDGSVVRRSPATACSTTSRAARRRAGCATTRRSRSTR